MKLNTEKTALVLGVFFTGIHFIWLLIVWFGWGQALIDWIFNVNLMSVPVKILPLSFAGGFWLLATSFIFGYVFGYLFAWVWNWLYKQK